MAAVLLGLGAAVFLGLGAALATLALPDSDENAPGAKVTVSPSLKGLGSSSTTSTTWSALALYHHSEPLGAFTLKPLSRKSIVFFCMHFYYYLYHHSLQHQSVPLGELTLKPLSRKSIVFLCIIVMINNNNTTWSS